MSGRPPRSTLFPYTTLFRSFQPGRVIELGCGTGTNSILLAQQGFEVTAVDISPLALEQARGKAASAGVTSKPDRKSTRLNSSHVSISYAVFCLKKKKINTYVLLTSIIPTRYAGASIARGNRRIMVLCLLVTIVLFSFLL